MMQRGKQKQVIRRYPCLAAVLFALGVCAAALPFWARVCAGAAVLAFGACAANAEKNIRRGFCCIAFCVVLYGAGAARAEQAGQLCGVALTDGENVLAQGRIIKKQKRETQFSGTQWTVHMTDCYLKASGGGGPCGMLIVYLDAEEPAVGNTISVKGTIQNFNTARNDGNFNERAYYQNQGYVCRIFAQTYAVCNAKENTIREWLYKMQQSLAGVYADEMPETEAGVLSAVLLGDKSMLENETKELYRQSGISHILAVSGLHVSILGAAFFCLFRKCGCPYLPASLVSICFIGLFGMMTGMGISTARAVMMFALYLGAQCCGRAYDSANALALAAVCLLAYQPGFLFLAGFQFSFAAVAGVLFGKELCRVFQVRLRICETVFISFGIQLFTLPLTAWYYFELPVYAMLLNFLVLPFMEAVLIAGLAGGLCGVWGMGCLGAAYGNGADVLLHAFGRFLAQLSRLTLHFDALLLQYFSKAGKFFLGLPNALYVRGQPEPVQMAAYYALPGLCIALALQKEKRYQRHVPQEKGEQEAAEKTYRKWRKTVWTAGALLPLAILLWKPPQDTGIDVLDVGQGDGIYIHTSDGADVLIDGGSTDVRGVGAYRILPFLKANGVSGVDYWFLSHLDADHISGFEEMIESGYPVGAVVLSARVLRDEAWERLVLRMQEKGIPVKYMEDGDMLRGAHSCFTALVLTEAELADDRNARSLVLQYEDGGMRGLFVGDISEKEEAALAGRYDLSDMTFYKAAHHGSQYSNSEAFLQEMRPKITVVSCALENDYGHPSKDAVARMERYSGAICYTMAAGQVSLRPDGHYKMTIRCRNSSGMAFLPFCAASPR